MTHIFVGKIIIISSDNGLSPDRCQAIVWTNAGLLSIEPLRTYFSENLIKIQPFSLKKMQVKMSSAKWRPSYFGLSVFRCVVDGYPILHGTPAHYCPHSNRHCWKGCSESMALDFSNGHPIMGHVTPMIFTMNIELVPLHFINHWRKHGFVKLFVLVRFGLDTQHALCCYM